MAIMENLTREDVAKTLDFFQKTIEPENKEAKFKAFSMSDKEKLDILEHDIASIELQLSELKEYISNIFNGHVLIDGQFQKVK